MLCRKKRSTVHQVSAEPSMTTMAVYTNKDGTVTYTLNHHSSMFSTVSLIMQWVIDDDDNGTPEDIFISSGSVIVGDEHQQDKKVIVKIGTGVDRNGMSIYTFKELFSDNGSTQNSSQSI